MDASCKVQESIHVFHLKGPSMCPGFWVHIIRGSLFQYVCRCFRRTRNLTQHFPDIQVVHGGIRSGGTGASSSHPQNLYKNAKHMLCIRSASSVTERVGFEPTRRFPDDRISSAARYKIICPKRFWFLKSEETNGM